jgi:hypothetical protein
VPVDPVLEVPEVPELDVPVDTVVAAALVGVPEVDVSAKATEVPTPARAPVRITPANNCFVRTFMVDLLHFLSRPCGRKRDLEGSNRGRAVKVIRQQ